ncbi:hypothetical protein BDW59DRAFT_165079 [Aspergillus cavernicola]|uniref:F-box domain-containing protein n=1 Tax=Aspergillus cavernicola TaxID=176166 RepID=A0ABR4HVC4_9EURO
MTADIPQRCPKGTDLLSSLPDELILLIGEELSVHSLNALIQASKRFYFVLSSYMYNLVLGGDPNTFNATKTATFAARTGNLATISKVLTYATPQDDHIKPG